MTRDLIWSANIQWIILYKSDQINPSKIMSFSKCAAESMSSRIETLFFAWQKMNTLATNWTPSARWWSAIAVDMTPSAHPGIYFSSRWPDTAAWKTREKGGERGWLLISPRGAWHALTLDSCIRTSSRWIDRWVDSVRYKEGGEKDDARGGRGDEETSKDW